jgi:DNA-binding response OmpR family regulator
MKILIVEDEKDLQQSMASYLQNAGMQCETATDLNEALTHISNNRFDCVVLDIGLPDGSGLKVIEELNKRDYQTGIVIVSAKQSTDDRIAALNLGADDFIVKPFHLPELVARLHSVHRALHPQNKNEVLLNELRLVPGELLFFVNDKPVALTRKEFELLLFMINNPNTSLTKEAIADHLWGAHADMAESFDFIYSHIKNLRKKILQSGGKDYIKSVYGTGYKFVTDEVA